MENKNVPIISVAVIVLILVAWSPWITKSYAEQKVKDTFNEEWKNVSDGCGFNCAGCGVTGSEKVLFGYSVDIEYGCGMQLVTKPSNERATKFVSFLGTVH